MSILDILKRRRVPNAEQVAAEIEAEESPSPWWNSKERWKEETTGVRRREWGSRKL